jgi:hypothetical protein
LFKTEFEQFQVVLLDIFFNPFGELLMTNFGGTFESDFNQNIFTCSMQSLCVLDMSQRQICSCGFTNENDVDFKYSSSSNSIVSSLSISESKALFNLN